MRNCETQTRQNSHDPTVQIFRKRMIAKIYEIKMQCQSFNYLNTNTISRYEIFEKNGGVGGTWYDNTYPGIACDVPVHLYSFSHHLNPSWNESFSGGAEIQEYLAKLAEPLLPNITFNTAVVSSVWQESLCEWVITLSSGRVLQANVIITGTGLLVQPSTPKFPGSDLFAGVSFHTNKWRNDVELSGKKIGVIGTGASAVQAVPRISDMGVESLTVFQRTPTWSGPRVTNFKFTNRAKFMFKCLPGLQRLYRWLVFWRFETRFFPLFIMPNKDIPVVGWLHEKMQSYIHKDIRKYITEVVKDPETADKLTPKYPLGCKRITPSNSYIQTFNKKNVHLVTEKIERITEKGVRTADEKLHDLDVIIYATGFDLIKSINAFQVSGVDGKSLSEDYSDEPRAYYGTTHHLCPNYFILGGPGLALGHNSYIFILECQLSYIRSGLEQLLLQGFSRVCLKERSMEEYQEWSRCKKRNKVFEGVKFCTGWYRNSRGVNWTFWPTNLISLWWYIRSFDSKNYVFQ